MSSLTDLNSKYDEDFSSGLMKIKPYILNMKKQANVHLCRIWLEKLIKSEPEERSLRNIYLEELCEHVQYDDLREPFNNCPSEGPLQTIPPMWRLCKQESVQQLDTSHYADKIEIECTNVDRSATETDKSFSETESNISEDEISARQYCSRDSMNSRVCASARVDSNTSYESFQEQNLNEGEEKNSGVNNNQQPNNNFLDELNELKIENATLKEEALARSYFIRELETNRDGLNEKIVVLNKNLENVNVELKQLKDFEKAYIQARKDVELWSEKYKVADARLTEREDHYLKKMEDYETSKRKLRAELEEIRNGEENSLKQLQVSNSKIEALEKQHSLLSEKNVNLEKDNKEMIEMYKQKIEAKNKEIILLKRRLEEQCDKMKSEIRTLKDISKRENDDIIQQLKSEINDYKLKISNMNHENNRRCQQYEARIDAMNKAKEMELCVQKMTLTSQFSVTRQKELENIISTLDEKYQARLAASEAYNCESKGNPEKVITKIELEDGVSKEL